MSYYYEKKRIAYNWKTPTLLIYNFWHDLFDKSAGTVILLLCSFSTLRVS